MSLITKPQFQVSMESQKFIDAINSEWQPLAERRLSLELEKSRLDGAPVAELNKAHIQKRRSNREAMSELIREEIAVLNKAASWQEHFYRDRDIARQAARTAYDAAIAKVSAGLVALGVSDERIPGITGIWASHNHIAHQSIAVRQAMTENGRNWQAMHPNPGAGDIQKLIDAREIELRGAVEAAA